MKFDDLDGKMRIFETAHDHCVLPGIYMVARLDGRGFTTVTKEMEKPFSETFRDAMAETVKHLMTESGFSPVYGYTQSDEISLLLSLEENSFGRKLRKLNSVLAGEASGKLSVLFNRVLALDCRISQLPSIKDVADYFSWRAEDSHRNCLHGYCYWTLRKRGLSSAKATSELFGATTAEKNELLFREGINYNDVPSWQKRGMGFYYEPYEKESLNPLTNEKVTVARRRIKQDMELPAREDYRDFIAGLLNMA